jgi:hypothetical protein
MFLRMINNCISKMFDTLAAFEFKTKSWIFTAVTSLIFTSVGFLFGAYVHPFLLLGFTSLPIYLIYLSQFKIQQYKSAVAHVLLWAVMISTSIISLTLISPSLASKAILSANSYKDEMFQWLVTSQGAEGNPSIFVPAHLLNAGIFTLLSLVTGGFLALLFGAYQMNYMNYYTGMLLLKVAHPTVNDYVTVSLLSWPVYAILRVFGFISIGIAATMPLTNRMFKKTVDKKALIKYLTVGLILIALDIIVKTLAAPYYQKLLHGLINLSS